MPQYPAALQHPEAHTCSPPGPGPHSRVQWPQSVGHEAHVSDASQTELPHVPGLDDADGAGALELDADGAGALELDADGAGAGDDDDDGVMPPPHTPYPIWQNGPQ